MPVHKTLVTRRPLRPFIISFWVAAILVLSPELKAKPLRAGVTYQGGETVEAQDHGVSIQVPKGWSGTLPAQSEFFILQNTRGAGVVLVYVDKIELKELKQKISSPIPADQFLLRPNTALKKTNLGWSMRYSITPASDRFSAAQVLAIHRHHTALAFIELSPKVHTAPTNVLKRLAESARIAKRASVNQDKANQAGPNAWRTYMSGRHVIRYFTSSGYTEETHLWLCSNGQFFDSMETGGNSGGASGASAGRNVGTWSATGQTHANGQLILRYSNGQGSTHDLALSNRKLYIDNKQWLRDKNTRCN